jgi:cytochrome c553
MFDELREMSRRRPEGIMDLQAGAYTEDQLRQISDYLATLPRGRDEATKGDARIEMVKARRKSRELKKRRKSKKRSRSKEWKR